MKPKQILSAEYIKSISYTDFVGLINQWNVLPGAYVTLSKWVKFSNLNSNSKILEIACTTGFTSREIALATGCSGLGLDISEASVKMAKYNKKTYAPNIDIEYICKDGYKFESKDKYTHIIFGAALRFFSNPEKMIKKSLEFLIDGGILLSSEFYVVKPIPKELINKAKKIFNFTPTEIPYKEVMKMYQGLDIVYEDKNSLFKETPEELQYYCKSTVDRACKMLNIADKKISKAIFDRLYEIKEMSNELRPYQNFNVLITRYRKSIYPNRYVELF